jgi:hypothetical protein
VENAKRPNPQSPLKELQKETIMQAPKNVHEEAKKHFAAHYGKREHTTICTAIDKHPETGRTIYLFIARLKDQPNERANEAIFDEESRLVEPGHLRKNLFPPKVTAVRPEIIDAVKVKVNPPVNRLRLGECDKFSETITVTIPASSAVAPADIYFLADNTGSMGPAISNVQSGASAMLAALGLSGLQFGVGSYVDFQDAGDPPSGVFRNLQPVTASTSAVQTAIGTWTASGGGDGPEAQLYALDQLAQPSGGSIGWRPGVAHIVVWFGDAPGHEPICKAVTSLGYDITEASVQVKLAANQITVLALSLNDGSGYANGLDDDPTNLLGSINPDYTQCAAPSGTPGQASRIVAATGGIEVTSVDPTTVVSTIIAKLKALLTINNVHLEPVGAIAPFVTSITPASYGPLPADQTNVLKFNVTFNGDVADCSTRDKVLTGAIDVVVDGNVVAAKPTEITVPACKYTYAVKFVCGTQSDCGCACTSVRPGSYATEINILNPKCGPASITKRFVPLVFAGTPTGREPAVAQARATEAITLPSGAATMDDCCRIAELLYGGIPSSPMPLTIGFLEIISNQQLHVTAVYTASDLKGNGLSFSVDTIPFQLT